jgi:hypothetical protein
MTLSTWSRGILQFECYEHARRYLEEFYNESKKRNFDQAEVICIIQGKIFKYMIDNTYLEKMPSPKVAQLLTQPKTGGPDEKYRTLSEGYGSFFDICHTKLIAIKIQKDDDLKRFETALKSNKLGVTLCLSETEYNELTKRRQQNLETEQRQQNEMIEQAGYVPSGWRTLPEEEIIERVEIRDRELKVLRTAL